MKKMTRIMVAAAFAGGLCFASPASWATTWENAPTINSDSDTAAGTFGLLAGTYFLSNSLSAAIGAAGGSVSQIVSLIDSANNVIMTSSAAIPTTTGPGSFVANGSSLSNAGLKTFTLTSFTSGLHIEYGTPSITGNGVSGSSISSSAAVWQAVPGPIAGAGLPALLGLMGFAGFRRAKKSV